MSEEIDWERRRAENTQLAIDLQRIYFKADLSAWAAKTNDAIEKLGAERVISGYANLCHLMMAAVKTDVGVDPLAWLDQIEKRVGTRGSRD